MFQLDDAGLDVLFHEENAYQSAANLDRTYEFEYVIGKIGARVKLKSGETHHSLWGNHLWSSSIEAAKRLEAIGDISSKSILELGAGLGLPSIVGSLLGAKNVVATDYPDKELLATLESNIEQNFPTQSHRPPVVAPLLWGSCNDAARILSCNSNERFDIIVVSDLIFNHVCHHQLLFTILELLSFQGKCICTYGHHVPGRREKDLNFFTLASEFRLHPTDVQSVKYDFPNDEAKDRENTNLVFVRDLLFEPSHIPERPRELVFTDIAVIGSQEFLTLLGFQLSKAGKDVLLVDSNAFYGEHSATIPLIDLYLHCKKHSLPFSFYSGGEGLLNSDIRIDLHPKLLSSQGTWTNFLIDEGIHEYVDFDEVGPVSMLHDGNLLDLPTTRADVFISETLSFVEKRKVCQFLQRLNVINTTNELSHFSSHEKLSDVMASYDLSPPLTKWIAHGLLQLDEVEAENLSLEEAHQRMVDIGPHGNRLKSTYLRPTYGRGDLVEGILRGASLQGLSSMVGQRITSIDRESSNEVPFWKIQTDEFDIRSRVLVQQARKMSHSGANFVILSKTPIRFHSRSDGEVEKNSLIVIPPGETRYVREHTVRVFTQLVLDGTIWLYHLHSFGRLSELADLGNDWVGTRVPLHGKVLTCGWDRSHFQNVLPELRGENQVCVDEDNEIYYSQKMLDSIRKIAQEICDIPM